MQSPASAKPASEPEVVRDENAPISRVAAAAPASRERSAGSWVLLLLVRMYVIFLSPLLGGACKFYPSCSNYAREAIERHGARRGTALALKRLLRCHPFTPGGVDLVPEELPDSDQLARAGHAHLAPSGHGRIGQGKVQ